MNKIENSKKYLLILSTLLLILLIMGSANATNNDKIVNETISTPEHGVDTLSTNIDSVDEKVSTADNTNNVVGSSDTSNKTLKESKNNNQLSSSSNTQTFKDLENLIKYTPDLLNITNNFTYNQTIDNPITINKNNYIIDFKGYTIDANS